MSRKTWQAVLVTALLASVLTLTPPVHASATTDGTEAQQREHGGNQQAGGQDVANPPPGAVGLQGPSELPGPVQNLMVTRGKGLIRVSWDAPGTLGNPPLDGYVVQYCQGVQHVCPDSSTNWMDWQHTGTATRTDITGLSNGGEYQIRVAAVNTQGTGPPSRIIKATPFSPLNLPGTPRNLELTPGDGRIEVSWDPPTDAGDPPVHGYQVYWRQGSSGTWTGGASRYTEGTSTVFEHFRNGQPYQIRVEARNTEGLGPSTPPKAAVPSRTRADNPERAPGAPQNLVLTPGDRKITVSWDAPSNRGNPPLVGYWLYWRAQGRQHRVHWHGDTSNTVTRTVGGLTNNTAYEVWVIAGNGQGISGVSPPSQTRTATPNPRPDSDPDPEPNPQPDPNPEPGDNPDGDSDTDVDAGGADMPGAPHNLRLTPGNGEIRVTWDPPSDVPAWRYFPEFCRVGTRRWQEAGWSTSTSATIDWLVNGVEYEVRVWVLHDNDAITQAVTEPKTATPQAP